MHPDEADIGISLVRRLLAAQFPRWADLPVAPVGSVGTANAMYRLGPDMVVRLPRIAGAAADVAKEHRWLPRLAPPLPVAIPVPLGEGVPAEGYPYPWSVYRWLEGETPAAHSMAEPGAFARGLAEFVTALRRIDPADAPPAYRSEPLAARDAATRAALEKLRGVVDSGAAAAAWESALRAPAWPGPPVWIHADLQPGNLLAARGRLSAVIDFGCAGVGDPAVDLIAAWYVLPADARGVFRAAVGADDAMWARGRGWALSIALMELSYYRDTHPVMATTARHVIGELLRSG
ncbi:aminoglycoside phosphotransferase family protein [Streptomyces sp. XD-27]|uniref:aminoglycoside phosphotransferase family protein n=1 Tax=Streptomyces sp. XD-27 TaxID=3062779 RepID=UPI0026F441B0|nr:aminoglycoside phosphotransferase family protein [Streptomyces sp. XD-27]WKX74187.1 aminoglycoside phosphotransferase family protein [Streptomyces sp. XD-27]